ncbi:hypothetical protein HETIRDRAFT_239418, partial [Heterobasidion irregulare TC 32-1]
AGIIGITTALKIQERGEYDVSIIAETFPTDEKTIKYTSHWAGAHHVMAITGDPQQQKLEKETFEIMWDLSRPGGEAEGCFLRAPQTEYYNFDPNFSRYDLSFMPDFRHLSPDDRPNIPDLKAAVSMTAININVPVYLPYLFSRFLARGGTVVRGTVQHVDQVLEGGLSAFTRKRTCDGFNEASIDALVVCAGMGTRTLGGVEDQSVYPVRGQTVLLHAPWVKAGMSLVPSSAGSGTYVIPRRNGDVIVGGTRDANDWYPIPRPETTTDILRRGLALCPELASPLVREEREPSIEDLRSILLEEGCGLRPARKGGIRLETEWFEVPRTKECKIPVIHNYGHGGFGFQTSWGSASAALQLLGEAL